MTNIPHTWQILTHREMIAEQGIMEESERQRLPLGAKLELADGRVFRYCKAGGVALAAGKTAQSVIVATERDTSINGGAVVAVGALSFTFTAVAEITANQFAEGFAHIVNDTGAGLQYKIKSNTFAAIAAETTITLYDPIVTALAATTDVILTSSPYSAVILADGDLSYIVGVPTIPVTALFYFWSQTGGVGMVLRGDSTGVATTELELQADVVGGTDGAGISTAGGAVGKQQLGYNYFDTTDGVSGEYWPTMLTIDH